MTIRFTKSLKFPALLAAAGAAIVCAGCSSSGSLGSGSDLIRSVDAVPDGGTATVDINSGTVQGNQTFFSVVPYQFINPGISSFSFTLTNKPATTYPTTSMTLVGDAHYTAVLTGLAEVASSSDIRYPRVLVLQDDQTTPPIGFERVRLVNTAPDTSANAGSIDLLINGNVVFSGVAYPSATLYENVQAGASTILIRQTGTDAPLAGPVQYTIPANGAMSIFATEPAETPPAYGIQETTDF